MLFAASFVSSVMTAACVIFSTSLVPDDTMRLLCVGVGGWLDVGSYSARPEGRACSTKAGNHSPMQAEGYRCRCGSKQYPSQSKGMGSARKVSPRMEFCQFIA